MSVKGERYWGLDAMRGLAAVAVVCCHITRDYGWSAHLAVDFFFALSGFVIARAYQHKLENGLGVMAFMRARLERLYPLYAIGLLFGLMQIIILVWAGLKVARIEDIVISSAANIIFLPTPSYFILSGALQGMFPTNGPAWSMFWELLINLIYAVFLFRLTTRSLVAVIAISFFGLAAADVYYANLNVGWEWPSALGGLPRVGFSFTVGNLLARTATWSGTRRRSWLALGPMALLLICLFLPIYGHRQTAFDLIFCCVISPAIIWAGIRCEVPDQLIGISGRIGYASYPLYILHRGPLGIFKEIYPRLGIPDACAAVVFIIGMVLAAVGISRLVDQLVRPHNRNRLAPPLIG